MDKEFGVCQRCGRKLKDKKSIELGFGKVCYFKYSMENLFKPLFKVEVDKPDPDKNN